jgi:hypothetical protein
MKNISIKAVALGCLADWAGTAAFGLAFGMFAVNAAAGRGMGAEQAAGFLQQWSLTGAGTTVSLLAGLAFTGLGGFVAARTSPRETLVNSLLVGIGAVCAALPFLDGVPLLRIMLSLFLSIPAALLGGFFHVKKLRF